MNKILEKIGKILNIEQPENVNLEDVKDMSGNIIRIDKFEVGGKVELISSDGTLIALTDGQYVLEDSREFTVIGGLISEITKDVKKSDTPETEIQPIANEDVIVPPTTEVEPTEDNDYEERIVALETTIAELKLTIETLATYVEQMAGSTAEFKKIKKQLEAEKEQLSTKVNELEKTPAGEPIVVKASKQENTKKEINYSDNYKNYLELTKKLKK